MASFGKILVAGSGLLSVSVFLHGYGSSPTPSPTPPPPSPTPSPSPPTTTTVTTTSTITTTMTTIRPRTPTPDPQVVADELNKAYYGYKADDPSSLLGVTMTLPSDRKNFYGNIFCTPYDNPDLGHTGCHHGNCDCRLSAALFNSQMIITEGHTIQTLMNRKTAIVFNQTLVETYLSRCFYVWDGATFGKYNIGCGLGAINYDCSSPFSAYGNHCPSTGKICTADDPESKGGLCSQYGGLHPPPPSHESGYQCAYPGPAISFTGEVADWTPNVAAARAALEDMVNFRLSHQQNQDSRGLLNIKQWNEIVMDVRLMMPKIWEDPAMVIPAFVYWNGDSIARNDAKQMRDEFCKFNQLEKCIPLLALDWNAVVNRTPPPPMFLVNPGDNEDLDNDDIVVM